MNALVPLSILAGSLLASFHVPAQDQMTTTQPDASALVWTPVQVEHLLNRAAFGGTTAEVERWHKAGPQALVDHLFSGVGPHDSFSMKVHRVDRSQRMGLDDDARRALNQKNRQANRKQIDAFAEWWIAEMAYGEDPLRERMTLIMHGWLVSAYQKVNRSDYLIGQNDLFRQHALGSYSALLVKILEDPAMLLYLDNNTNRKGKPNENLARELLELFSLGEGNYSEKDIKQAARALTGYTVNREGFFFAPKAHDEGEKTVLGVTGEMSSEDLVEVIQSQPAYGTYVAARLIYEFEGIYPGSKRAQNYAKLLRERNFELQPFLRRLFFDPAFYRKEVLGTKVQSPVDFMVGAARKLEAKMPSALLYQSSSMLGQKLMDPPSVKGWDGGFAWLTESSLMLRSNAWGAILGEITPKDLRDGVDEAIDMMDEMMEVEDSGQETEPEPNRRGGPLARLLQAVRRNKLAVDLPVVQWLKDRNAKSDSEISAILLDQLLAIPVSEETHSLVENFIKAGRKELKLHPGKLLSKPGKAKQLLTRTIHLILSLPEANLG